MSELRLDQWVMPAASMGDANPLPPLEPKEDITRSFTIDASIPEEDRTCIGFGMDHRHLPYLVQDQYDRVREPRVFRTAVLENEHLRATFLLEHGGRLWSLYHKPAERELLYVNPVFQPANLAIRNAWFSGGVEWNFGNHGHATYTCDSVFAARLSDDRGEPILRLYEFDRIRRLPFQADFMLPDGLPWLFVRVRLVNRHDHSVPMYWWSNIAVPESEGSRVLVPARAAYTFGYQRCMQRFEIPEHDGVDVSYPTNVQTATDFFYVVNNDEQPWITSLDDTGRGLIQCSTPRLAGRKLFVWGMNRGGRNWQRFLTDETEQPYIEIQAGLARTQMECLPMPAGAEWAWTEGYGLLDADPQITHGDDWDAAVAHVEESLGRYLPLDRLKTWHERIGRFADAKPVDVLYEGSGWGALEQARCEASGSRLVLTDATPFVSSSLGAEQQTWLELIEARGLPEPIGDLPDSYQVEEAWRGLLEAAVADARGCLWAVWLYLGVIAYHDERYDEARGAWEKSLADNRTTIALRNLAILARDQGNFDRAATLLLEAHRMKPDLAPLVVETGDGLVRAERWRDLRSWLAGLGSQSRVHGRIRLCEARLLLHDGKPGDARDIVEHLVLDDLRESDNPLTDLWFACESACRGNVSIESLKQSIRPPEAIDFRLEHVD